MFLLDERIPQAIEAGKRILAPMLRLFETSHCDCFWCGKRVNVHDPRLLWFSPNDRFAPELPIHADCLDGKSMLAVDAAYRKAICDAAKMAAETDHTSPAASGHA